MSEGHIRRRGKRRWQLKWELPRDPRTGKRVTRYKSFNGTKKAAYAELTRILGSLLTGAYIDPNKITVADQLKTWLETVSKPKHAPRTYERHEEIVRLRLIPAFGHALLTELHPLHIQRAYAKWLESGRADGTGGLSPQTVLHFHKTLHQALKYAVKWRLLIRNPCADVDSPEPQEVKYTTLTEDQLITLLKHAEGKPAHIPILIAATTGLRLGEVLGLKWADIELDKARLTVNRAASASKGRGLYLKDPKSKSSKRTISLARVTVEALRLHLVEQKKYRLSCGKYQDCDLVCPNTNGRLADPKNFTRRYYRPVIRSAGVPYVKFHELRHSHLTLLLERNVHPKVAQARAGHSSISITMDTYSHVSPEIERGAANVMDEIFKE